MVVADQQPLHQDLRQRRIANHANLRVNRLLFANEERVGGEQTRNLHWTH